MSSETSAVAPSRGLRPSSGGAVARRRLSAEPLSPRGSPLHQASQALVSTGTPGKAHTPALLTQLVQREAGLVQFQQLPGDAGAATGAHAETCRMTSPSPCPPFWTGSFPSHPGIRLSSEPPSSRAQTLHVPCLGLLAKPAPGVLTPASPRGCLGAAKGPRLVSVDFHVLNSRRRGLSSRVCDGPPSRCAAANTVPRPPSPPLSCA